MGFLSTIKNQLFVPGRAPAAQPRSKAAFPATSRGGPLAAVGGWWPRIREPFTGAWQRNEEWLAEDLLQSPIVYACTTLIANDIGKLRARIVRRDGNGIWSEDTSSSIIARTLRRPNRYQNQIQFKQWWIMSKLRFGNAYALLRRDADGVVTNMYLLDPLRVTPMVTPDGSVYYQLGEDNLGDVRESVMVPASDIIHDRMNCLYHPLVGVSPLYAAAIAAGIGIRIQRNSAQFYLNNATPSGILIAPGVLEDEDAEAIKKSWHENYRGKNAGSVAILSEGFKFEPMGQKAVDAQLIQTLGWTDERVCSVFHVPAYKVGVGQMPAYNNIEALSQEYYGTCLQTLIEEMEACLDDGLGLVPELFNRGIELDLDGLLRMDTKTLMDTLKVGVDAYVLTPNEARKRANKPPLEGGDTVYMQQQDYPLDQVWQNRIVAEPAAGEGATGGSATGSIQQEAMNGAQVTALQGIIFAVGDGSLDSETAAALIRVAFPLVTEAQIEEMLSNARAPAPAPAPDDEEEPADAARASLATYRAIEAMQKMIAEDAA